jgi:xanthine phosphoribosyltransferase
MTKTQVVSLDWEAVHRDTLKLASQIARVGTFTGIIAVARGGLIPAGILASALGIRRLDTICLSSYEGKQRGELRVIKSMTGDGAGWLIIDELSDTGATAKAVKAMLPEAYMAVVYAKPEGLIEVDDYAELYAQDTWLVFPWETSEEDVELCS